MKNKNMIYVLAFIGIIGGMTFGGLIAKDRTFSPNENRYLSEVPDVSVYGILSGEFQTDFESYLNDQILFRDQWITIRTAVSKWMGNTDIGGAYVGKNGYDFEKITPEDVDEKLISRNTDAVEKLFAYCKEKGMTDEQMSFVLVPTSGLVYEEYLPTNARVFDQAKYLDEIVTTLSDYNCIDMRKPFAEQKEDGLYYRTDHHWTSDGAFLAYKEWREKTGRTPVEKEDYEVSIISEDFRGSLHSKILDFDSAYDSIKQYDKKDGTGEFSIVADGEALADFYEKSKLEEKDQYAYFFGGNYGEVVITNSNPSEEAKGRSILVIKDSFANSFVPFLAEDFETVYMMDLRYCQENVGAYMEEHEISEVLVLYNISNFMSDKNVYKLGNKLQ